MRNGAIVWCRRRDLNPEPSRATLLKRLRMPFRHDDNGLSRTVATRGLPVIGRRLCL